VALLKAVRITARERFCRKKGKEKRKMPHRENHPG